MWTGSLEYTRGEDDEQEQFIKSTRGVRTTNRNSSLEYTRGEDDEQEEFIRVHEG